MRIATLNCIADATRSALLDWQASTTWWLTGGVLVAAELATGTFYLLMLALGCAAGALAAHAGLGAAAQVIIAAIVGAGATWAWHRRRRAQPQAAPAASNRDVNLDIGQTVRVAAWLPDGTARVPYRGADWSVRWAGPGTPAAGDCVIVALNGSELHLAQPASH
jgi:membrane protein implicated in regulation of membrane protease activity